MQHMVKAEVRWGQHRTGRGKQTKKGQLLKAQETGVTREGRNINLKEPWHAWRGYCLRQECFCSKEKEMTIDGKKVHFDERLKQIKSRMTGAERLSRKERRGGRTHGTGEVTVLIVTISNVSTRHQPGYLEISRVQPTGSTGRKVCIALVAEGGWEKPVVSVRMWLALEAVNIEGSHHERLDVYEPRRPLHPKGEGEQEGEGGFPKAITPGNDMVHSGSPK